MKMQLLYGALPVIKGKGFAAKAVADILDEIVNERFRAGLSVRPARSISENSSMISLLLHSSAILVLILNTVSPIGRANTPSAQRRDVGGYMFR
jgi:hypothetical protein